MKEREGNYMEAINLYLKAGLPAKAARLAMSREVGLSLFVSSRERTDALLKKLRHGLRMLNKIWPRVFKLVV